ncbi:hypothetical protein BDZ94DRAFT_288976 [Collybia nuda]|uniref:Uncharacterized protein n=1 Tax=Collybia nuda TaxID=64659 RepID=A0A9P5XUF1_9AGAR|nr:hypothetical protein BDZ94DRAFT_288976 [Collybia nuda]
MSSNGLQSTPAKPAPPSDENHSQQSLSEVGEIPPISKDTTQLTRRPRSPSEPLSHLDGDRDAGSTTPQQSMFKSEPVFLPSDSEGDEASPPTSGNSGLEGFLSWNL